MSTISEFINKLFRFLTMLFSPSKISHSEVSEVSASSQEKEETDTVIAEPANDLPESESLYAEEILTVAELMAYLTEAESYTIHYNKGERGKTAPLGVYHKHFPDWTGWTFLTHIAQEHEIKFDPATSDTVGCKALTEVVQQYYKDELDALLYDFIQYNVRVYTSKIILSNGVLHKPFML